MKQINCLDMICPDPLNILRNEIRSMSSGDRVSILSNDPASLREIPAYCNFIGHKLIKKPDNNTDFEYIIEKK